MEPSEIDRLYVVRQFSERGLSCPAQYLTMLLNVRPDYVIDGLYPWDFFTSPEEMKEFCSEVVGHEILPFAQAVGEDTVACFDMSRTPALPVLVIDPWNKRKPSSVLADLPDYDAWLVYAKALSDEVIASEREEGLRE